MFELRPWSQTFSLIKISRRCFRMYFGMSGQFENWENAHEARDSEHGERTPRFVVHSLQNIVFHQEKHVERQHRQQVKHVQHTFHEQLLVWTGEKPENKK